MLLLMMRFAVVIVIHPTEIPLCETIPCDVIELVMELREQRRCSQRKQNAQHIRHTHPHKWYADRQYSLAEKKNSFVKLQHRNESMNIWTNYEVPHSHRR